MLLKLIEMLMSADKWENKSKKEVKSEKQEWATGSDYIGEYIILRWYDSGVHFGILDEIKDGSIYLKNSRRIRYRKTNGIDLTALAQEGLKWTDSKICAEIERIQITDSRISEIIPCSKKAIKTIKEYSIFIP